MTEKEKMISGKIYDPSDKELTQLRQNAHRLCTEYNVLPETDEKRGEVLKSLGINGSAFYLQGPVQFDYGCFTTIGVNSYANFNFTCVDCCPVTIGDNVFMGPNVSLLTPMHPLRWQDRNQYAKPDGTMTDKEYAKPITIGNNCWIAGNVRRYHRRRLRYRRRKRSHPGYSPEFPGGRSSVQSDTRDNGGRFP